jgi:hypothetical protein
MTSLMSFDVIQPTLAITLGLADRVGHVRPRAARHRDPAMTAAMP